MEGPTEDRGVNHRSVEELFSAARSMQGMDFSFTVSILEVYNENIRDLLAPPSSGATSLDVRLGKGARGTPSVYVEGLTECQVDSLAAVEKLMSEGGRNRSVGSNNVNLHSSRSHLVLCVKIQGTSHSGSTVHGKLNLIDLAGSERLKSTNAEGQRLKEAQNINKSLSALGDVINALGKNSTHVPYRNSKLSFLLQDSLSAHARVLMFVNITPALESAGESQCSLNFAGRCRAVQLGTAKKSVRRNPRAASE